MNKVALKALALAGACYVLAAGAAQADVIYNFVQTSASGGDPNVKQGYPFTGDFQPISLTFANAQVAAGSTAGTANCNAGACTGLPGFISSTSGGYGSLIANLTFSSDGSLSGSINNGLSPGPVGVGGYDFTLSGSGAAWTGVLLGTDDQRAYQTCGVRSGPDACTFTGYFTASGFQPPGAVPEPATFAVLAIGLLGSTGLHRRLTVRSTGEA